MCGLHTFPDAAGAVFQGVCTIKFVGTGNKFLDFWAAFQLLWKSVTKGETLAIEQTHAMSQNAPFWKRFHCQNNPISRWHFVVLHETLTCSRSWNQNVWPRCKNPPKCQHSCPSFQPELSFAISCFFSMSLAPTRQTNCNVWAGPSNSLGKNTTKKLLHNNIVHKCTTKFKGPKGVHQSHPEWMHCKFTNFSNNHHLLKKAMEGRIMSKAKSCATHNHNHPLVIKQSGTHFNWNGLCMEKQLCWCPIQGRLPVPRYPRLGIRE